MDTKDIEDFFPLSPMQQGMLFHSLLSPDSGVYIEQVSCTLKGEFNLDAFRSAWQQLLDSHAVLRTSFISKGVKEPLQVVHKKSVIPFDIYDWQSYSVFDLEENINATRLSEQQKGFDVQKAPLMRFILARISKDSYFFLWTYHHILLDGWSMPLVFAEVMQRYAALSNGKHFTSPQQRSYRDYIVWLKKQNRQDAENFWKKTLKDLDLPLKLFKEKNRMDDSGDYSEMTINISNGLTRQLQAFAGKYQLTMNTLVQGAWSLLLGRYSSQKDVIFGTTVSGRPADLSGSENIIGLLINTLPVRVKIGNDKELIPWLKELQEQLLEMRQFEYSSLVEIQKLTKIPASQPLFENILVFENYPAGALKEAGIEGIQIQDVRFAEKVNYPLALVVGLSGSLQLRLLYDLNLLDSSIASNMLESLKSILESFLSPKTLRLKDLDLISSREMSQILRNGKNIVGPEDEKYCLHELFEEQVKKTPDNLAVVFNNQRISYRQLDEKANQLANYLVGQGIKPEDLVGILLDKSADMIISVLGILKSGAAYVPIDPSIPEDRLEFIIKDSKIKVLITQSIFSYKAELNGTRIFQIDQQKEELEKENKIKPESRCLPENLAYVIYTSGSTGKPKGVLVPHSGACNFVRGLVSLVQIKPRERWLQFFSLSFDGSVGDIFPVLISGASLYIPERMTLLDPRSLERFIRKNSLTTIFMTPSAIALLNNTEVTSLETIISGGEACSKDLAMRLTEGRKFFNAYGPTEASVAATMFDMKDFDQDMSAIPIGGALMNAKLFVLDSDLKLVPAGCTGELYIGGQGVVRGYLNKPELTAEKFIPNPFADQAGERVFKTGDLVRLLPEGRLEYVERIDHQVKIRGFRIELGEIELVIRQCGGIRDATVDVRQDSQNDKKIIAYIIPEDELDFDLSEVKSHLSRNLPNYMLPSRYVLLKEFPLNSSGKIDKAALPEPEENAMSIPAAAAAQQHFSARDAWELNLVQIWEEILNVRPVGIKDNFFDLGGHSLLAIRLMDLIQDRLGRQVPLVTIYQNPTIELLTPFLRDSEVSESPSLLVEMKKEGGREPLFFVHPSGGSVHWYAELAKHIDPEIPFYGIEAIGINGKEKLDDSIEVMASRYIDIILQKQPYGPYSIGGWSFGVIVAFEIACQLTALGHKINLLALLDNGPVLKSGEPKDSAELLKLMFAKTIPLDEDFLRTMEYEDQYRYVFKLAKKANLIPFWIKLSQFSFYIHILKTMQSAWRKYNVKTYPGEIVLFRSEETSADQSVAFDMGWGSYASKGVNVIDVPGDHISMMLKPNVQFMAGQINMLLNKNNQNFEDFIDLTSGNASADDMTDEN